MNPWQATKWFINLLTWLFLRIKIFEEDIENPNQDARKRAFMKDAGAKKKTHDYHQTKRNGKK